MKKRALVAGMLVWAGASMASWYWPFQSEEPGADAPRLSELLEPASVLIDEAADLAADGKVQDSVEKYRKALAELDRIEAENPERVKSAEFATVRNKRAYVNAAIDTMLLSQVRNNAKAVAVSDTTELERKLAAERAGKGEKGETPPAAAEAKAKTPEPADAGRRAARSVSAPPQTRRDRAIAAIAAGEFKTAEALIGAMLREKPNGAMALNLKAAMEMRQGRLKDAEATLDRAIVSNPRSAHAYCNMAYLVLLKDPANVASARRYYETGRAMGGAADPRLEEALK